MNTEKLFNKFFVNYLIDDDKYDLMPMKDFEFYVKDRIKSGFIENVSDLIKDFYFAINKGLFSWSDKYVIWKNPTSPISFTTLEDFESKFERINRKSLRKYVEHTVGASFDELEDFESKMGSRNEENDIDESTNINQAKKLLSENGFYVFKKAKKLNEAFSAMESDDKDMKYYIKELDTLVNYHNKNLQKGQYYFLCDFLDFLKDSYIYESTKLNEKSLNQYNDVIEAVDDFKGRNFAEVEQFLYDNGCECIERDLITDDGQKAYDEIWLIASADGDKQWNVRIIYNAKDKIINFVETWEFT